MIAIKIKNLLNNKLYFFFFLTLLMFLLYAYSILQPPRADLAISLFETNAISHSYYLLLKYTVIFNDTNKDPFLFRPLLSTERFLFQYNFVLWQCANIFFHIAVIYFLFGYLKALFKEASDLLVFLLSLLAGVFYAGSEMVFWPEVGGYMVFCVAMLISQTIVQRYIICCN